MLPLFTFLVAGIGGGILVAGLTAFPVRRLDRALREFRERGFRGGIDAKSLGLSGELASTVTAINEMGGVSRRWILAGANARPSWERSRNRSRKA